MDLTNLNRDRKRRKSSLDLSTMVYGKVPPQAKDLEEAVLGAIMLEKNAFDTVAEILKPECFYVESSFSLDNLNPCHIVLRMPGPRLFSSRTSLYNRNPHRSPGIVFG